MAETLLVYHEPVVASDGTSYEARACGAPMTGSTWEAWIEFVPIGGGEPLRSGRETTQPNRTDAEYWATGLSQVYLEGALRRALATPPTILVAPPQPSMFDGPAPRQVVTETTAESVLDPFAVYEKGEALLRRQLGALARAVSLGRATPAERELPLRRRIYTRPGKSDGPHLAGPRSRPQR